MHFASTALVGRATDSSRRITSHPLTIPITLGPEARRLLKYQTKLRKAFLDREIFLDCRLSLEQSIDEAKRRLDWKVATSAGGVDENEREI